MFKKQTFFIIIIMIFYLSTIGLGINLIRDDLNSRLIWGNIFENNKVFDYLVHLVYLDGLHSKLVLKEGLPVVRVRNDHLSGNSRQISPVVTFTCEFITDLPPSFFKADEDEKIREVASRVQPRKKITSREKKKIRAEGRHKNEKKQKVKLDFWQTEPSFDAKSNEEATARNKLRPNSELDLPNKNRLEDRFGNSGALVGIYHTHTSENYGNRGHKGHAEPGNQGDIVKVGSELKRQLESKYGIKTVHSPRVHDKTYARSYIRSLNTSKQIVNNNPNLKMMFDIHRDAIGKADKDRITTTINGQKAARIMIIVTNNEYGLPHPNWRENLQFAKKLAKKMEEMYPGLLRDVELIENRRYNLHVHSNSLLLEIGGAKSTLEEAKRSARLLTNVLADLLEENI